MNPNTSHIQHDNLLAVYTFSDGSTFRQGKRVSPSCPLTTIERKTYVKEGALPAVKFIATSRSIPLHSALALLHEARGEMLFFKRYRVGEPT